MSVLSPAWLLFAGGQSTSSLTFLSLTSSSYHVTVSKPLPACAWCLCHLSPLLGAGNPVACRAVGKASSLMSVQMR